MRPREDERIYDGPSPRTDRRQYEPISPPAKKNRSPYGVRYSSRSPPRRRIRGDSYRPGFSAPTSSPPAPPAYESWRPPRPNRLRDTFRRDDPHDTQDRRKHDGRRSSDQREDFLHDPPAATASIHEKQGPGIEHYSQAHSRPKSPILQQHSFGSTQSPHFSNLTWVKPAQRAPLASTHSQSDIKTLVDVSGATRRTFPPVDRFIKQSPHVFIPASCLPIDDSIIKHLENSRAKLNPAEPDDRRVFVDDTGYFVTFSGDPQGRLNQAMWFRTNEHTLMLGKYRLDAMKSIPGVSNEHDTSLPDIRTPTADTETPAQHMSNVDGHEQPTTFDADDHSFSIRGAASAGSRKHVSPGVDKRSAIAGDFAIKGAATTLSSVHGVRSPSTGASLATKATQAPLSDSSSWPQAIEPGLLHHKLPALPPFNVARQDKDDAASTTSGVGSDTSGSKALKCHVCRLGHTSTGPLVKCSTCSRNYHSHCLAVPPTLKETGSDWQCDGCKRKGIPAKRRASQTVGSVPESNPHKRRRLSSHDENGTDNATGAAAEPEPARSPPRGLPAVLARTDRLSEEIRAAEPNVMHGPPEFLNDDEADNLVAKSFALAPTGASLPKGSRFKAVKRKISMQGHEEPIDHEQRNEKDDNAGNIPHAAQADYTAASASTVPEKPRLQGHLSGKSAAIAKLGHTALQPPTDTASASPFNGNGNRVVGKKAKRTHAPKFGESKCTSCKKRDFPPNPFGRTICQPCKDQETGVQSRKPSVSSAMNQPVQPPLGRDESCQASSGVEPGALVTAEAGDGSLILAADQHHTSQNENELPTNTSAKSIATDASPVGNESADISGIHPVVQEVAPAEGSVTLRKSLSLPAVVAIAAIPAPTFDNQTEVTPTNVVPDEPREAQNRPGTADVNDGRPETQSQQQQFATPSPHVSEGPSPNADATDETDGDDVPLADLMFKRSLNPNLGSKPSRPATQARSRRTQYTKAKDQFDLGDSFERPKNTYIRLIHMAISDSAEGRLKRKGVVQWICDNIPRYRLHEGKWANGISATMTMRSEGYEKNGGENPTLRRYPSAGGEDWFELLPKWKDKAERWDATLARPVSPLAKVTSTLNALRDETLANRSPSKKKSTVAPKSINASTSRQNGQAQKAPAESGVNIADDNDMFTEEALADNAPSISPQETSTGIVNSTSAFRKTQSKAARTISLQEMMDVDTDVDDDDDASIEQPVMVLNDSVQSGMHRQSVANDMETEDLAATTASTADLSSDRPVVVADHTVHTGRATRSVADNVDFDSLTAKTVPLPKVANSQTARPSRETGVAQEMPMSILDMTVEEVLACRPPAVHKELAKAWPSLDPKKTSFDYEAKMAEIRARPGRKARFGQKRPVDVNKILSVVGPSESAPWPPIDNSLGLTQEQLGDEMILKPCETWDEFFGTTEEARPCIVDGKLAYRPVAGRSRAIFKTSI